MDKMSLLKYFLSKVEEDSAEAFACVREIIEDDIEKEEVDEMIESCNDRF